MHPESENCDCCHQTEPDGKEDTAVMTPWGPAASFADAVVMYAMHSEKVPLGIAQTARDQFEEIDELARKQHSALGACEGVLASILDGNPEPNLRAIGAIHDLALELTGLDPTP